MQEDTCKQTVHEDSEEGHDSQGNKENVKEVRKANSATCKPIVVTRPNIKLPSYRINAQIKFMRENALIGKFIGFFLAEKVLQGWITANWKPKGHITLQLGPKGFFTEIFNCLEDRNEIIDGGPYFFNAAGLYLKEWVKRFNPDKGDLS